MLQKCLNLSRRTKKGQLYWYCRKQRKIVECGCHRTCSDAEYKKQKPLKAKKPIKLVSKNKKTVSDKTYYICLERDENTCQLCGLMGILYNDKDGKERTTLHLHHISYRSEDKNLIDEPTNCIFICGDCHEKCHSSKEYWQPILKEISKKNNRRSNE